MAKKKLSLEYIDDEYEPEVHEYKFKYENGEEITETAMECPTLPTIYLQPGKMTDQIIVILFKPHNFEIRTEMILPKLIRFGMFFAVYLSPVLKSCYS